MVLEKLFIVFDWDNSYLPYKVKVLEFGRRDWCYGLMWLRAEFEICYCSAIIALKSENFTEKEKKKVVVYSQETLNVNEFYYHLEHLK